MSGEAAKLELVYVNTMAEAQRFLDWIRTVPAIACDTETSGVKMFEGDVVRLLQLGDGDQCFAFPREWMGVAHEAMEEYDGYRIYHNHQFDVSFLQEEGLDHWCRPEKTHDTMFMMKVLHPTKPAGLKPAAAWLVSPDAKLGEQELKDAKKAGGWDWATVPTDLPEYWVYGCLDVCWTYRLFEVLHAEMSGRAEMSGQRGLIDCYELEMSISPTIMDMKRVGVLIDQEAAEELDSKLVEQNADNRVRFEERWEVPVGSNDKIAARLVDLGVELTEKTKTGKFKMNQAVLSGLDHELVHELLNYRAGAKLRSTYTRNIITNSAHDGRIRADINQRQAVTGRMSSSGAINLQNLPAREGPLIRDLFIAGEGNVLIGADFSQQELRILAEYSQDDNLIKILADENVDAFVSIGSQMFPEDPLKGKNDPRRNLIKTLVYALIYGAGPAKIGEQAGITTAEATDLRDRFYVAFPGVPEFMNRVVTEAKMHVTPQAFNRYGGRLVCEREQEYKLTNYVIQSTAAHQLKLAIQNLINAGLGPALRLLIHDEVVLEVPNDLMVVEYTKEVEHALESTGDDYLLPFPAEASIGDRLGGLK